MGTPIPFEAMICDEPLECQQNECAKFEDRQLLVTDQQQMDINAKMKQEEWADEKKGAAGEKGTHVKDEVIGTENGVIETAAIGTEQSQQITPDQTDIYRELILRHLIADISGTCAKLGLSTDLAAWSSDDCRRWVAEMCAQFQLNIPEEGAFAMDGRRLLALSVEEFQDRFPDGGDTLHAQLQLWKTAFESCGQPIGAGTNPRHNAIEENNANANWLSSTSGNCADFLCPSSACCSPVASSSSAHQNQFHVTQYQKQHHFYNSNANSALFEPRGHANAINKAHQQQQQLFRQHAQLRSADLVSFCASSSLSSPPDDSSSVADDDYLCSSSASSSSASSSSSADVSHHRLSHHFHQNHQNNNAFFSSCPQNFLPNSSNNQLQHNQQQAQVVVPFCHFADQQPPPPMAHSFHQNNQQQQFQHSNSHQQQQQHMRRVHPLQQQLHQQTQQVQQRVVCSHGNGGTIHLWHFIRELLDQPRDYGGCVRWVDRKEGTFKIESSHHLARFWGLRKNRTAMNYDKLSRSLRQYYKKGIIQKPEKKQRLVYKFLPPYNQ